MTAPHAPDLPYGATAQRPLWPDLPEAIQTRIEERLGGKVVAVASQGSGFTPGFASRLVYGRGQRAFVKAASETASPSVADSYRVEARTVPSLPAGVPAPALRWTLEEDGWVVLCFDDVPGRPPMRPWQPRELTDVLTALTDMAQALTPAPAGLVVPEIRDWMGEDFGYWDQLRSELPDPDRQVAELAALESGALDGLRGDAVVHCDLRDDNLIIGDDGRVWVCDWNWPSRGAPWFDLLTLLISARGDGYDADALFAVHPLGAGADPDAVDAVLAGLSGYFTGASLQPAVSGSPHLRTHQAWCAQATLSWLAVRRGWVG
ncbi:phosphotransferase family protein [Actinopolymorpha alba]|uniref:phosphotransferase family protein n=1 Tax=Actinopolymorpha alba TaxID=533267 RepID=UPI00035C8D88|nr:phosphotransferase [Actinopolymorpha alba]